MDAASCSHSAGAAGKGSEISDHFFSVDDLISAQSLEAFFFNYYYSGRRDRFVVVRGFNQSTVVPGALGWVSWISRAGGTFQQIPVHLPYLNP